MLEIITSRLRLRDFTTDDAQALYDISKDTTQFEHMLFSMSNTQEADEFLDIALSSALELPRNNWHLAVEFNGLLIGSVDIMSDSSESTSAELGYWFAREYWGRGYASEASLALLKYIFSLKRFHRIWGKCHVRNQASARVMEKLGMKFEGIMREHAWLRDHWRSSCLYAILEDEFFCNY